MRSLSGMFWRDRAACASLVTIKEQSKEDTSSPIAPLERLHSTIFLLSIAQRKSKLDLDCPITLRSRGLVVNILTLFKSGAIFSSLSRELHRLSYISKKPFITGSVMLLTICSRKSGSVRSLGTAMSVWGFGCESSANEAFLRMYSVRGPQLSGQMFLMILMTLETTRGFCFSDTDSKMFIPMALLES